jgi:hypothetical protein
MFRLSRYFLGGNRYIGSTATMEAEGGGAKISQSANGAWRKARRMIRISLTLLFTVSEQKEETIPL